MRTLYISLPTVLSVQKFVEQISLLDGQFDMLSDDYILDAKSLMGVFRLDLTKPIKLRVEKDSRETMRVLKPFVVKVPSARNKRKKDLEERNE